MVVVAVAVTASC